MRAVVVYESMFGNTHVVADQIAEGLRSVMEVTVASVERADAELLSEADLIVVGGPTHAHGMTSKTSRASAADMAAKDVDLDLDPDAEGPGLRDWFDAQDGGGTVRAAAFDTRIDGPAVLTGRASKGIGKRLHRHHFVEVADPESFLVDKQNHLLAGEADRARTWGAALAASVGAPTGS